MTYTYVPAQLVDVDLLVQGVALLADLIDLGKLWQVQPSLTSSVINGGSDLEPTSLALSEYQGQKGQFHEEVNL